MLPGRVFQLEAEGYINIEKAEETSMHSYWKSLKLPFTMFLHSTKH